jgi:branched-chain amino acid transport system permease protein
MNGLFIQLLVNSVVTGSMYALYGVSFGVIYRTTKIFHFSHHFVFALAGYSAALSTKELGISPFFAFVLSIVTAVICGCSIDGLLYRNLRRLKATQTTTFLASMGLATVGVGLILLVLSVNPRPLIGFPVVILTIGDATFTTVDIGILITSWTFIGFLITFLSKSKYGKAILAVGSNPDMAMNLGISKDKVYTLVFALGSALFGVGAFLYTAKNAAYPTMGMVPFFMSFTAVFLGGVQSIWGHAIAGVVLGFAETLGMLFVPSEFKTMIVFGILIIVIILSSEGLMGISKVKKRLLKQKKRDNSKVGLNPEG